MNTSMNFKQTISRRKTAIAELAKDPMALIAEACISAWPDADTLDKILLDRYVHVPYCNILYALDAHGRQISSNISSQGTDRGFRGQDLSARPFLKGALPYSGFILSAAYLNKPDMSPCITALHAINHDDELLGFLMADFRLHELPIDDRHPHIPTAWKQFKGDPTIRSSLFSQKRIETRMDEDMGNVLAMVKTLMMHHGVFHTKLLFSSSRATLWLLDDPYNYRLHDVGELVNPEACLAYPRHEYPAEAKVDADMIHQILSHFMALRFADDTIYLRSASLNIMNGMVGLTFSCDGSHYFPADEFLEKDLSFWLGSFSPSDSMA